MIFKRTLDIKNLVDSAFLFGPRMTGKTFLLKGVASDLSIDLLDPEEELKFKQKPRLFWEQISALKTGSLVIIDEVQRVPSLLDYVQKGIEEKGHKFILSGSSARKLKRGGANLLGGRARNLKLHPLTASEIGPSFKIEHVYRFGSIPKVASFILNGDFNEARQFLKSYYTVYIKEEIQAEAITRNIGAFQRFLNVAAQSNAQIIEFANISRECSVPMSTVKEYFTILEDTLIGEFLWPWDRSERKKARPKFYFFDCGVVLAIQNRLYDPPTPAEIGFLFETWFVREIIRLRDYNNKPHEITFWRQGNHEIDIVISGGHGPILGIECKSGSIDISAATINTFRKKFPNVPLIVSSLVDNVARRLSSGIEILPWRKVLERYIDV